MGSEKHQHDEVKPRCFHHVPYFTPLYYLMSITFMKSGLSLITLPGVAFLSPARNLPPLICQYCPNSFSTGSLCSLDVMMKSYPSASKSFIIEEWYFNVPTNVEAIFKVKVSFSQLGIFFLGNSRSNLPWHVRTMVCYLQLQLHFLNNLQLNTELWN